MYSIRTGEICPKMRQASVTASLFIFTLLLASVAPAQEFRAEINAAQAVPLSTSSATGLGCFTLDADNNALHYEVSYSGLESAEVAAHIHVAPVGSNGMGAYTFPLGAIKIGTVELLTVTQIAEINAGLWYVNIHSTNFLSGEIRGQILPAPVGCTVSVEERPWGFIKTMYRH